MKQLVLLLSVCLACTSFLAAQNVGIGQPSPASKLHITNNGPNVLTLDNSQPFTTGFENHLHFKAGAWYTGGIRSIHTGLSTARLGFFTKPHIFPSNLLERLSILDDGKVGINTITPASTLDVNGTVNVTGNTTLNSLTVAGGQPGTGKVLMSDWQGNATWKKINEGVTSKLIVPAFAFKSHFGSAPGLYSLDNGHGIGAGFAPNTFLHTMMAPVSLPEGAIVKKISAVCYLNHPDIKGTWTGLRHATLTNNTITNTVVEEFSNFDVENPNVQKVSSPLLNHVVTNSNRVYWASVSLYQTGSWEGDKSIIFWLEIEYEQ
jgi:hypothetical protein